LRILSLGGADHLTPVIQNEASGEVDRQYLSAELAKDMLGWKPVKRLDEGLRDTIAWYDSHRGVL
jgi:CDP-glucose 4,6-dehydratase